MNTRVIAKSPYFERHLHRVLGGRVAVHGNVTTAINACKKTDCLLLVHLRSLEDDLESVLGRLGEHDYFTVGVAADRPQLEEMLAVSRYPVSAYFNSFMTKPHYDQLIRMLGSGQTWFHPQLLAQALGLARRSVEQTTGTQDLTVLTNREREIALDVAQGFSNKRIATGRSISERTVKTHLTKIFKKLHVADRTSLAVRLTGR